MALLFLVLVGTVIMGLGLVWLIMTWIGGRIKDLPLGPVNLRETDPEKMKANDRHSIESQYRLYRGMRRLVPWALGGLIAGVVLIVIGAELPSAPQAIPEDQGRMVALVLLGTGLMVLGCLPLLFLLSLRPPRNKSTGRVVLVGSCLVATVSGLVVLAAATRLL